nr:hypothetical protein [Abalone asfa-like virus]
MAKTLLDQFPENKNFFDWIKPFTERQFASWSDLEQTLQKNHIENYIICYNNYPILNIWPKVSTPNYLDFTLDVAGQKVEFDKIIKKFKGHVIPEYKKLVSFVYFTQDLRRDRFNIPRHFSSVDTTVKSSCGALVNFIHFNICQIFSPDFSKIIWFLKDLIEGRPSTIPNLVLYSPYERFIAGRRFLHLVSNLIHPELTKHYYNRSPIHDKLSFYGVITVELDKYSDVPPSEIKKFLDYPRDSQIMVGDLDHPVCYEHVAKHIVLTTEGKYYTQSIPTAHAIELSRYNEVINHENVDDIQQLADLVTFVRNYKKRPINGKPIRSTIVSPPKYNAYFF